jgi:Holliday junction resolvasome RuvABC DNA-binding subunit
MVTVSDGQQPVFRHADGTPYGAELSASSSLVQTHAFQALRSLGFGEGEVRRALAEARQDLSSDASVEQVLRYSLERLTARACQRAS